MLPRRPRPEVYSATAPSCPFHRKAASHTLDQRHKVPCLPDEKSFSCRLSLLGLLFQYTKPCPGYHNATVSSQDRCAKHRGVADVQDEVRAGSGIYRAMARDGLAVMDTLSRNSWTGVGYTAGFRERLKTEGKKRTVALSSLEMPSPRQASTMRFRCHEEDLLVGSCWGGITIIKEICTAAVR